SGRRTGRMMEPSAAGQTHLTPAAHHLVFRRCTSGGSHQRTSPAGRWRGDLARIPKQEVPMRGRFLALWALPLAPLASSIALAPRAAAQEVEYTVRELPQIGAPIPISRAYDINDAGMVA